MSEYYIAKTTSALEKIGIELAKKLNTKNLVFLSGKLGAGKTTLSRGILRGLGYQGLVKSPTYSIVETYVLDKITVHHFDLYRIQSEYELEDMGFRDYFTNDALILIEWAEKAKLPKPDVKISVDYHPDGRKVTEYFEK